METNGILIINKPGGITSHDVVDRVRQIVGIRQVGHAGTLDPMATGVLIVLVGQATKLSSRFLGLDKVYSATIKLGYISDTYDKTGQLKEYNTKLIPDELTVKKVLAKFVGVIDQIPPMYSAKKVKGKKLYELARQGKEIIREPKKITIYKLELKEYSYPLIKIIVECSTGTYIRSLAYDIGEVLKTGAYLEELVRLSVGDYNLEQAVDLAELTAENWREFLVDKKSLLDKN
ncbi:MAG: tRNA pseudouridine(55) synthase TruB [bacterium]